MKYNILVVTRLKSWGPDREILLANFNKKNFFGPNQNSKTAVERRIQFCVQLPSQNFDFFSYFRALGPIPQTFYYSKVQQYYIYRENTGGRY